MHPTGWHRRALSLVVQLFSVLLLSGLLLAGSPCYAEFDPPRIIYVINPDGAGQPSEGERTYYINKGIESSINMGDVLNVYREIRASRRAPAIRLFIGTMRIGSSQTGSAMGHFTANETAMTSSVIRRRTAMKSDIVVPILVIDSGVLFDPGQISLKPNAAQEFQKVADFVDNFAPGRLVIEGHTDSDGDEEANQSLSEARAEAVRLYLIETYASITPAMVESRGYGETRPKVANDTPENKTLNRRIEVIIWE